MTQEHFETEREGQLAFYQTFLPRIHPSLPMDAILADDNDGVLNGNLLEFKLRISNLNATLFQCIKYLSARRIKGKPVPANILLIDLNEAQAYLYHSADYLSDIEKVYVGGASKDNKSYAAAPYLEKYSYGEEKDASKLIQILKEKSFIKIHLDENCIVGWASAYYHAVPSARKEDFIGDDTGKHKTIGEIREPSVFKDYIYPYTGKTNVKFQYLMDKLNDTLQKKNLGAFYTPELYAEKSHELLRKAIARVPAGNDYIILDRCAGTGNLEKTLPDEILSHCILSTVEYYEYKVLQELLGTKVRHIVPPVEAKDTFQAGLVRGADALSKAYIDNPVIREFVDNPNCTVILFENPPYAETTSIEHQKKHKGKKSSLWKQSYVMQAMREDKNLSGTVYNDLGNLFIWSAFHFYLRQPTDSYIVYSPVKYWKAQHLIDREFLQGFAFNRKFFHTNIEACIMVALWGQKETVLDEISLDAYNIVHSRLVKEKVLPVRRVHSLYSAKYYDKRTFSDDTEGGIFAEFDGTEASPSRPSVRIKPISNPNILGYLVIKGANFDNPDSCVHLTTVGAYDANGFYLRSDNYLEKLPMFCASRYITYNRAWTERARIMKSGDGAARFEKDASSGKLDQWLRKCLLFTCLEMQNHMRSFHGSDGHFYRNELCLDTTNGETIASHDLETLFKDDTEKKLFSQWDNLLAAIQQTDEYQSQLTYGIYQIHAEIDTFHLDEESGKKVYHHVVVHSALRTIKELLKDYYNTEIVPTLFTYEFLK